MISLADIEAASRRIGDRVRRTPLLEADGLIFKLEFLQHTGSFKARGMINQVLAGAERGALPEAGIVAASGGNAGLAAAYAARAAGVPAEVFVPRTAPAVKVEKLAKLGAHVVQEGSEYAEAYAAATVRAAQTGALFCHAYDDADMVAGSGAVGLELLEQLPGGFDTVLVSVGGGGLFAGLIAALHGHARVVAVEPITSSCLHTALQHGSPIDVPVSGVAADSLGARQVGRIAFDTAVEAGARSVLVDDKAIADARRRLWDEYRIVTEHGTSTAYAAITSGAYLPADGERVVVVLCGANTNPGDL